MREGGKEVREGGKEVRERGKERSERGREGSKRGEGRGDMEEKGEEIWKDGEGQRWEIDTETDGYIDTQTDCSDRPPPEPIELFLCHGQDEAQQ